MSVPWRPVPHCVLKPLFPPRMYVSQETATSWTLHMMLFLYQMRHPCDARDMFDPFRGDRIMMNSAECRKVFWGHQPQTIFHTCFEQILGIVNFRHNTLGLLLCYMEFIK